MDEYSLIKKFAENCTAHPNHTAIIDVAKDTAMTYHELDDASGKVYRYLTERGIGKEDVVMILLPRGAKPFAAIVGVWKAGAAYVMLETDYPAEKREFIKRDTNCKLVIDENVFEEMMKCEVLEGYKVANPHDLSYIVYTSGTTGNPKGVMHEYGTQNLAVMCSDFSKIYTYSDRLLFLSPLHFTAAVIEFHMLIAACSTIVLLPLADARNIEHIMAVINEYKVTIAFFTPSLLRLISKLPESIKKLIVAAEAPNNIYYEGIDIYCKYGQSESGFELLVFCPDKKYEATPAGKPTLSEINVCIQDENGNLVEDGKVGEICYRNPYFRGYLNLPEKNASVFRKGYVRSGDMAKILPDGNFLVLGRIDDMVKINGNRVEPAEIEVAVKHVLGTEWVGVRIFTEGQKSFVCAYYIGEPVLPIEDAKKIISEKLVSYMVPAFYIKIDKIPVSSNGKFKRNDLPAPDFKSYIKEYVAPSNELEEKLCQVMASVLCIERVGVENDFYEIGGDSICVIKVITQMKLDMLDVNMFLAGRTARKIAALYKEAAKSKTESLEEQNAQAQKKDLPLSTEQIFMFDYQSSYPDSLAWYLPTLLKFGRNTDMGRLKKALDTVLKAHPVFSTVYVWGKNNEPVQRFNPDKIFDTKIEEITEAEFETLKKSLVQPFDLLEKPLYRIRLFKTERGGYLFCNFHHSISDGTSIHILLDDITKAYNGKAIEPDYYFAVRDYYQRTIHSPLYEEAKQYYDNLFKGYETLPYLNVDFDTEDHTLGTMNVKIPIEEKCYEKMQKVHGLNKNAFFIVATCIAVSAYNERDEVRMTWIHNGRTNSMNARVFGFLYKCFGVGMRFSKTKTLENVYLDIIEQIRNNIHYSYYVPEWLLISADKNINLNYLADLESFSGEGELAYTFSALPLDNAHSDNLLDIEILDIDDGCCLELKYNASAYKKESINRFKNMFMKTACLLMEHIENHEMKVMEIISAIRK